MLKMKKTLSMILALAMFLSFACINVSAAETLPTALEAPSIKLYDSGSYNSYLAVKAQAPESVVDFYEKGYVNGYYGDASGGDTDDSYYWTDYGAYSVSNVSIQLDYKVDNGAWHYDSSWDTSIYDASSYGTFNGSYATEIGLASISSYNITGSGIAADLNTLGCLTSTTDGSYTYYRFDQDNHKITVRARYIATVKDQSYNTTQYILSPWSAETSLGQNNKDVSTAPTSLSASTIKDLRLNEDAGTYYGSPYLDFDIMPSADVVAAMQWSEQYDEDLEDSYMYLIVEASLDPNFGEGSVVYTYRIWESESLKRWQTEQVILYGLWEDLPDKDHSAFNWDGETVYVRTKYRNTRTVNGSDSSIESPYSNTLSYTGSVIKKYDITITHNPYGFDKDGYYSENYSRTEGRTLDTVYCSPLEGCYVQKVTVNGVVKYDKDDDTTHSLLDWYYDEEFDFIGAEDIASQDLDIVITYAGTPTAKYGIATEEGAGGCLTTYDSYVSWSNNSLVVYHGSTPEILIRPYGGFEIDKVLVDGVENTEAKAAGKYKFPAITDDSHSISATFNRVAYEVSSYVYHGTLTADYAGYTTSNDYVKIGDDIKFTFAPAQDANGLYYEIERVYIDGVLNETAKTSGTYTFEDVQSDHSISVYYSDDPVVTHDITASSGDNGSISPEGVVHARENSTQRFYFYPDEGYEVDKVTVDGVEITNLATTEYYNIANVTEEHTIHVTFKKMPVQYKVNVIVSGDNPTAHTVNPKGETPVWEGESFSLSYSPFAGYEVSKVTVDGTEVEKTGTYSISNMAAHHTIEITFKIKSYKVTFVDHDGTVLKTETVEHGSQATPPSDPTRAHYVFTGWDTTYSDITTNVTVRATYDPAEYTVKFIGWNGNVLKTEKVEYQNDATAPTPPAREGYDFSHWNLDYTNVSEDLNITAVYTLKEYTVKFVDSDDSLISTQQVKYGKSAAVPNDPEKDGYTFVGWDNLNYGHVTQDMTVKAKYVQGDADVYTITATAHGNTGSVSPSGQSKIEKNGSVTIHFYPDEFSKIVKVVVDGTEIDVCSSHEFTDVTSNHTVDVYFAPTAKINVSSKDNATGTASGHYELLDDQMVYIFDVTPAEGYVLDAVYVNGVATVVEQVDGRYVIRNLSEDADVKVAFKKIQTESFDNSAAASFTESEDAVANTDSPSTMDTTNTAAWIAAAAVTFAGVCVTENKKRKCR